MEREVRLACKDLRRREREASSERLDPKRLDLYTWSAEAFSRAIGRNCASKGCKKAAGDDRDVATLDVRRVIHGPHVGGRNPAAQAVQRGPDLGISQQRAGPRHDGGVVRRKIVPRVIELNQIETLDEARCRVAGD